MKTFLLLLTSVLCLSAQVKIQRAGTNVIVTTVVPAYAATLEVSSNLVTWTQLETYWDACPSIKTHVAPATGHQLFFRVIYADNGVVPTPSPLRAWVNSFGAAVYLDWPMVFQCNDDPVAGYRVYRNGVPIGYTAGNRPYWLDQDATGVCFYAVCAVVGSDLSLPASIQVHVP